MPDHVLAGGRHRAKGGRHRAKPRPMGQRSAALMAGVWVGLMLCASFTLAIIRS